MQYGKWCRWISWCPFVGTRNTCIILFTIQSIYMTHMIEWEREYFSSLFFVKRTETNCHTKKEKESGLYLPICNITRGSTIHRAWSRSRGSNDPNELHGFPELSTHSWIRSSLLCLFCHSTHENSFDYSLHANSIREFWRMQDYDSTSSYDHLEGLLPTDPASDSSSWDLTLTNMRSIK